MPNDPPPSNAKIYPRPEKAAPSPLLLALCVVILLALAFFAYRFFVSREPNAGGAGAQPPAVGAQNRQR